MNCTFSTTVVVKTAKAVAAAVVAAAKVRSLFTGW